MMPAAQRRILSEIRICQATGERPSLAAFSKCPRCGSTSGTPPARLVYHLRQLEAARQAPQGLADSITAQIKEDAVEIRTVNATEILDPCPTCGDPLEPFDRRADGVVWCDRCRIAFEIQEGPEGHHSECWKDPGHHSCAIQLLEMLSQQPHCERMNGDGNSCGYHPIRAAQYWFDAVRIPR